MGVVITDCYESLPLEIVIESYENHMRGQPKNTHSAVFDYDLKYFAAHARQTVPAPLMRDVTRGLGESFIDSRLAIEAPSTVARRIASVIAFCGWAADNLKGFANPMRRLSLPRQDANKPKGLSAEQSAAMLQAAGNLGKTPFERARNRVIIALLDLDGLRSGELRRLILASFSPDLKNILKIWGKGRHFRSLPCPSAAQEAVRVYLPFREHQLLKFDGHFARRHESVRLQYPLLVSSQAPRTKNRNPSAFCISPRTIYRVVAACGKLAGIAGVHPHTLRHTFALELLDKTKDLALLQQALGHRNINTTTRYTIRTQAALAAAMG